MTGVNIKIRRQRRDKTEKLGGGGVGRRHLRNFDHRICNNKILKKLQNKGWGWEGGGVILRNTPQQQNNGKKTLGQQMDVTLLMIEWLQYSISFFFFFFSLFFCASLSLSSNTNGMSAEHVQACKHLWVDTLAKTTNSRPHNTGRVEDRPRPPNEACHASAFLSISPRTRRVLPSLKLAVAGTRAVRDGRWTGSGNRFSVNWHFPIWLDPAQNVGHEQHNIVPCGRHRCHSLLVWPTM